MIELTVNRTTKTLVRSLTLAEPAALRDQFREDEITFKIRIVEDNPDGGLREQLRLVDITALSLKVGIGDRKANSEMLALQDVWTKDTVNHCFTGSLNLNTTPLTKIIDDNPNAQVTAFFEIEISEGGKPETIFQQAIKITGDVVRNAMLPPSEVEPPALFANTLEAALVNSDSIYWTRNGDTLTGQVNLAEQGGLKVGASGVYVDIGTGADQVAPGDKSHDALTVCDILPINAIAAMTQHSENGVTVSAVSETAGNEAWKGFDGNESSTTWNSGPKDTLTGEIQTWIQVEFDVAKIIRAFDLRHPSLTTVAEIKWIFSASNNGVDFDTLQIVDFNNVRFNTPIAFQNETPYTHYRLTFEYRPDRGPYTSFVHGLRMHERLPSIIHVLNGQDLCSYVRVDPNGGLEVGPNGLRIKTTDTDTQTGDPVLRGRIIYANAAPNVTDNPEASISLWVNTSTSPRILNAYNSESGNWEPVASVTLTEPTQKYGGVIVSEFEPDVNVDPNLKSFIWLNQSISPPAVNIYDAAAGEWVNQCEICDSQQGGYGGKLSNPTFSPPAGTDIPVEVTINHPVAGVTILYTDDGSAPTHNTGTPTGSTLTYTGPINVSTATTLKALAFKGGWNESDVTTANYAALDFPSFLLNVNFTAPGNDEKVGGAVEIESHTDYWLPVTPLDRDHFNIPDVEGSNTGVQLDMSGDFQITELAGTVDPMYRYGAIIQQAFSGSANKIIAAFSKLPPGVYDVIVYSHGNAVNFGGNIDIDAAESYPAQATSTSDATYGSTAWVEGKQYVKFADIEVGLDGAMVITANEIETASPTWFVAVINGIQIRKKNQLRAVQFSKETGYQFSQSMEVALSVPQANSATIFFTDDGSEPAHSSGTPTGTTQVYSGPISITATKTIKALAYSANAPDDSIVSEATYTEV